MERMYYSTIVSFRQAGKEKNLKIYLKTPGGELRVEKDPISERRFMVGVPSDCVRSVCGVDPHNRFYE